MELKFIHPSIPSIPKNAVSRIDGWIGWMFSCSLVKSKRNFGEWTFCPLSTSITLRLKTGIKNQALWKGCKVVPQEVQKSSSGDLPDCKAFIRKCGVFYRSGSMFTLL